VVLTAFGALIGFICCQYLYDPVIEPILRVIDPPKPRSNSSYSDPNSAACFGTGCFLLFVFRGIFGAFFGAFMVHLRWYLNVAILGIGLFMGVLFDYHYRVILFQPIPTVERVGNFELVTNENLYSYPYKPVTTANYRGLILLPGQKQWFAPPDSVWSTRVGRVQSAAPNALIFNTYADDRYPGSLYLVYENEDGASTETRYLCASESPILDRRSPPRGFRNGPWLLLGHTCLLDVLTLSSYPLKKIDLVSAYRETIDQSRATETQDNIFVIDEARAPLAVSPDQRSVAHLGLMGWDRGNWHSVALVVRNRSNGTQYNLPIDSRYMDPNEVVGINESWLNRYFIWQRATDGFDRLGPRPKFPWKGLLISKGERREYFLAPVKPKILGAFADLLIKELRATRISSALIHGVAPNGHREDYEEESFQIGGDRITLMARGRSLVIKRAQESQGTAPEDRLIETLGRSFDSLAQQGILNMYCDQEMKEALPANFTLDESLGPLALSPDQRSLVRVGWIDSGLPDPARALLVYNFSNGSQYTIPIDRGPIVHSNSFITALGDPNSHNPDRVDNSWFDLHFYWERADDGYDRPVPRKGSLPIGFVQPGEQIAVISDN
jgi:hypothetical protein